MRRKRKYIPNLISDMAECDANYIRLRRLFPAMDELDQLRFGVDAGVAGDANLLGVGPAEQLVVSINIIERCRYTTMLNIVVSGDEDKPWVNWPCLEVRVYHDVKSAEVTSFEGQRNFKFRYALPNAQMHQPDEKSQINKFFGELLTYSYEHGHSLDVVTVQP